MPKIGRISSDWPLERILKTLGDLEPKKLWKNKPGFNSPAHLNFCGFNDELPEEATQEETSEYSVQVSQKPWYGSYRLFTSVSFCGIQMWRFKFKKMFLHYICIRHEQYYWVGYWYWVILGCYWKLVLVLGIVKAFLQNWYWYWVLLKPFCKIGIGIGYC